VSESALTFQEVIIRLQEFWTRQNCILWQPYSEKVGAGTMNPATVLRVLGPEPWHVVYVEPSYRPDDGRFGENPNRMQMHTQLQVILKPDPGNPQEIYLESLAAIGIRREEHDIRFVEDNWESPALGAWGLGWEVWLDGMEITQFTYFQQAGGQPLEPVSVELTYGLERIIMFLQGVNRVWDIRWNDQLTYGDVLLQPEIDHCRYDFHDADVERLLQMYKLFEAEAENAIAHGLVVPAHDYVLRCSHTFNVLDARGAIGVTERASFFARMRDLSRRVALLYLKQREEAGFPWLRNRPAPAPAVPPTIADKAAPVDKARLLLEVGCEELPVAEQISLQDQLRRLIPTFLDEHRLPHGAISVTATPRRLIVQVDDLAGQQEDQEQVFRGPDAGRAFDEHGQPTKAAIGFARSKKVDVSQLQIREDKGKAYVFAVQKTAGRPTTDLLTETLPSLIGQLRVAKGMRWLDPAAVGDAAHVTFSRPLRWFVALFGTQVLPFRYAGLTAGAVTRGSRAAGSPDITIPDAASYEETMRSAGIIVDWEARRAHIAAAATRLAAEVGGNIPNDPALLDEVTGLVEQPTALRGSFDPDYLELPEEVLIGVMRKHQRYFPVVDEQNKLMPYFIAVRNGSERHLDIVRAGNEAVLRARYADAQFFWAEDSAKPLVEFTPRLATLTFQERLGSMLDKVHRLEALAPWIGIRLGLGVDDLATVERAAQLCKSDLVTQMVVEMTSLQGIMGREYALRSGEPPAVANAIFEHYLPRFSGDALPESMPGLVVGLANKLDSLVGLFAVGLAPTGSTDPYHLRRDALGVVQSLIARQVDLSLRDVLSKAASLLPLPADDSVIDAVLAFIAGRLQVWLREQGYRYDVVDAVLAEQGDNPFSAYQTVNALQKAVNEKEWADLLTAWARTKRIVRKIEERYPLAPETYTESATKALHAAWETASAQMAEKDVTNLVAALRVLRTPIDRFFDEVLVMTDDDTLRAARLALLQHIADLPAGIADLSRLQGF